MKATHGILELKGMKHRFPMFMDRWGLKTYAGHRTATGTPVVFFGCYSDAQRIEIAKHMGDAIVVWMGSDFDIQGWHDLWRRPNMYHVAIGPWLQRELDGAGLRWRRVNLVGSPLVDTLHSEPLGAAVYCYMPEKRRAFYGGHVLDEVRRALPDVEFIVHNGVDVCSAEMPAVYRRCYIGLRLARHDGGSEGVIEMGLMGRRSVHNGDTPASINWSTVDDIVGYIKTERSRVAPAVYATAQDTRGHIETGSAWLDTTTWNGGTA